MDIYRILGYLATLVFSLTIGAVYAVKPTNLAKEVICEGCHAIITEADSILGSGKRGSAQVRQALQNVCQVNRLTKYEFSPPNMVKACDYWKNNYIDEVKDALSGGGDVEDQEIELCFVETDVCQGVDRSHFRINKYSGPSKSKLDAALNTEEEEIATDEEGETGEEVFANDGIDEETGEDSEEAEDDSEMEKEEKSHKKKKDGKKEGKGKKGTGGKKDKVKNKEKGEEKKNKKGKGGEKSSKKDGKKGDDKNKKNKEKKKDNKEKQKDNKEKKKGKKSKKDEL